jgi:hypothetical protein
MWVGHRVHRERHHASISKLRQVHCVVGTRVR